MNPLIPRSLLQLGPTATLTRAALHPTRAFSASSSSAIFPSRPAQASTAPDLTFPSKPNPSPFEIFHLDPRAPVDPKALKARFYQLSRLYHPDLRPQPSPTAAGAGPDKGKGKGKGKASDGSEQFRQIVEAYEVLKDARKRGVYLRSGRAGGGGGGAASWNEQGYNFRRGRPMTYAGTAYGRGEYPSASWDWR